MQQLAVNLTIGRLKDIGGSCHLDYLGIYGAIIF
jgi:hypothetical protein